MRNWSIITALTSTARQHDASNWGAQYSKTTPSPIKYFQMKITSSVLQRTASEVLQQHPLLPQQDIPRPQQSNQQSNQQSITSSVFQRTASEVRRKDYNITCYFHSKPKPQQNKQWMWSSSRVKVAVFQWHSSSSWWSRLLRWFWAAGWNCWMPMQA